MTTTRTDEIRDFFARTPILNGFLIEEPTDSSLRRLTVFLFFSALFGLLTLIATGLMVKEHLQRSGPVQAYSADELEVAVSRLEGRTIDLGRSDTATITRIDIGDAGFHLSLDADIASIQAPVLVAATATVKSVDMTDPHYLDFEMQPRSFAVGRIRSVDTDSLFGAGASLFEHGADSEVFAAFAREHFITRLRNAPLSDALSGAIPAEAPEFGLFSQVDYRFENGGIIAEKHPHKIFEGIIPVLGTVFCLFFAAALHNRSY